MSLMSEVLGGAFTDNFKAELSNACAAGSIIGFTLLAIVVVWGQVRNFVGGGSPLEGLDESEIRQYISETDFSSASEYAEACEINGIEPDFGDSLQYMDEEEIIELFENSEEVEH